MAGGGTPVDPFTQYLLFSQFGGPGLGRLALLSSAQSDRAATQTTPTPHEFLVNAPGGGISSLIADKTPAEKPGLSPLEKIALGTMLGGQLSSWLNPPPQPLTPGPVSGPSFNPSVVNTQQFVIPAIPAQTPIFRL